MIDELRDGQIVEFDHDPHDAGCHRHDGRLKRYVVFSVDARSDVVLLRDRDTKLEALPLEVVKKHMVVLQEPSPQALPPPGQMTKDDVFNAVFEWMNHQNDCDECAGEIEGGELSERYRYLCDEAKTMLAWFVQRP